MRSFSSLFAYLSAALPRLGRHQARAPRAYAVAAVLIVAASVPFILKLQLNSDLTALLPTWMQSVKDLAEVSRRFGQPATLGVLVNSPDPKRNGAFVRKLAPRLAALGPLGVTSADWSMADYQKVVADHKYLFLPLADLQTLRKLLRERVDREKARANPLFVELSDEKDDALEKEIERLRPHESAADPAARYTDGFFTNGSAYFAIFLRTRLGGGDFAGIEALTRAIDKAVVETRAELDEPLRHRPEDLLVDYGGGILDSYAEQKALTDAALLATVLTVGLVGLAILVFFRRWTSIPVLFIGIVPPIALTFGIAFFLIDYINASSAFLTAIVIGNGINPHIVWYARYLEERRAGRSPEDATAEAHQHTWPGTLSASLGAALAYGALVVTDFRAFRDFGFIGGIGMVLCWLAVFLFTPVVANAFERWLPTPPEPARRGNVYGRAVAFVAFGAPRLVLAGAALMTVVSLFFFSRWAMQLPIEYDFRKLQSTRHDSRLAQVGAFLAGCADAAAAGNGIAVLARTPEDLPAARAAVEEYGRQHPGVIGAMSSIAMLLPPDQEAKIPVLADLRALMLEARPHLSEAQQKDVDEFLPPEKIEPMRPADLPGMVARPFTELDGTRGAILYVQQADGANQFDGNFLRQWTAAARAARNRDGSRVAVAGYPPVVGDLVEAIARSGPRTVAVSFVATFVLLFFTFFRTRDRLFTFASHMMGVIWMLGCMAWFGVKVNFLNFIALPVTFGLGIDYSVNVMRRFVEEEAAGRDPVEAIRAAVQQTGGAVILCSLTTVIGYLSLFTSPNQAVNSFGIAMSLAEETCLVSAVIVLPAALLVVMGRRGGARSGG